MERYQRLLGVDLEHNDADAAAVANLARKVSRCMLLSSNYLKFKPSQMAAASLLLSMQIVSSP